MFFFLIFCQDFHYRNSRLALCCSPRSRIPRCAGHRRVTVKSFTAESELLCMRYVSGVRLLCWQTTRRVRTLLCMRYFSGVRLLCRQTTRIVRTVYFAGVWLSLKGQSGQRFLRVVYITIINQEFSSAKGTGGGGGEGFRIKHF